MHDQPELVGVVPNQPLDDLGRVVSAPVVDHDHLELVGHLGRDLQRRADGTLDVGLLVEGGQDDREARNSAVSGAGHSPPFIPANNPSLPGWSRALICKVPPMSASGRRWARPSWRPVILACAPLLFAVPILLALNDSFEFLVGSGHPFFGDVSGTSADARAVSLGVPLYQDPAAGYTPLSYTPLFNVLGGALGLVTIRDGRPVVLTGVGALGFVGVAAWLGYRPQDSSLGVRIATAAGAVGMGTIAFWLVAFVPFSGLWAPRPDVLAWAFALTGLVLVPAASRGSKGAGAAAVVLLTLGWWTKQPMLVAALAAVLWLTIAAARGATSWRIWSAITGGLVLVGAASFGLMHLLTDGWSTVLIFDMPRDRARPFTFEQSFHDMYQSVVPAAAVALAFWAAALFSGSSRPTWRHPVAWIPADAVAIGAVLGLFVLVDIPASLYFRDAVGAAH